MQDLGLDVIEDQEDIYETPDGYRRLAALDERTRQAQQEQDAAEQAEHERNARLLDFGRRAGRLVLDHIGHITKRATPLPDSARILAKAVMFVTDNKGDLGKVDAGEAYDDTWGADTNLFHPDDGHRQQAALYMLLMAGMDGMTPADWGDPDRGLDRFKDYYDLLAQTGYKPCDGEKAALEGAFLPKDEQEEPGGKQKQD